MLGAASHGTPVQALSSCVFGEETVLRGDGGFSETSQLCKADSTGVGRKQWSGAYSAGGVATVNTPVRAAGKCQKLRDRAPGFSPEATALH